MNPLWWFLASAATSTSAFLIGRWVRIVLELHAMDRPAPRTSVRNGTRLVSLYDQERDGA